MFWIKKLLLAPEASEVGSNLSSKSPSLTPGASLIEAKRDSPRFTNTAVYPVNAVSMLSSVEVDELKQLDDKKPNFASEITRSTGKNDGYDGEICIGEGESIPDDECCEEDVSEIASVGSEGSSADTKIVSNRSIDSLRRSPSSILRSRSQSSDNRVRWDEQLPIYVGFVERKPRRRHSKVVTPQPGCFETTLSNEYDGLEVDDLALVDEAGRAAAQFLSNVGGLLSFLVHRPGKPKACPTQEGIDKQSQSGKLISIDDASTGSASVKSQNPPPTEIASAVAATVQMEQQQHAVGRTHTTHGESLEAPLPDLLPLEGKNQMAEKQQPQYVSLEAQPRMLEVASFTLDGDDEAGPRSSPKRRDSFAISDTNNHDLLGNCRNDDTVRSVSKALVPPTSQTSDENDSIVSSIESGHQQVAVESGIAMCRCTDAATPEAPHGQGGIMQLPSADEKLQEGKNCQKETERTDVIFESRHASVQPDLSKYSRINTSSSTMLVHDHPKVRHLPIYHPYEHESNKSGSSSGDDDGDNDDYGWSLIDDYSEAIVTHSKEVAEQDGGENDGGSKTLQQIVPVQHEGSISKKDNNTKHKKKQINRSVPPPSQQRRSPSPTRNQQHEKRWPRTVQRSTPPKKLILPGNAWIKQKPKPMTNTITYISPSHRLFAGKDSRNPSEEKQRR